MDTSKLTFAVFTLDESDHCFAGFHDPSKTWNGWNCPFFYQHEVERMRVVWAGVDDVNMDEAVAETKMPADSPFLPIGSHSWTWFEVDMRAGREFLLQPIKTLAQAEAFCIRLNKDGLDYHFDDEPGTVIDGSTHEALFNDAEAAAANCRVWELREIMGDPFGLPVALTNTVDGKVFRLQVLEGDSQIIDPEHDPAYYITSEFTEELAFSPKDMETVNAMIVTEQWQSTGPSAIPFILTRIA